MQGLEILITSCTVDAAKLTSGTWLDLTRFSKPRMWPRTCPSLNFTCGVPSEKLVNLLSCCIACMDGFSAAGSANWIWASHGAWRNAIMSRHVCGWSNCRDSRITRTRANVAETSRARLWVVAPWSSVRESCYTRACGPSQPQHDWAQPSPAQSKTSNNPSVRAVFQLSFSQNIVCRFISNPIKIIKILVINKFVNKANNDALGII